MPLSLDTLEKLVASEGVAIRIRQRLQPAGGPGDKIFPPTYATGDQKLKYAVERRKINGREVDCVLLDSVASQANRMEEALLAAWEADDLEFPVLRVEFDDPELADIGSISALQAPHRIADAILRDSTNKSGTVLFRNTIEGKAYTDATTRNATAVFELCPTALLFGVWDSTGPKGGLGAKFQRALASEIVAIDAVVGVKVKSRLDPLAIGANVPVFQCSDDENDWTIEESEAKRDEKGNPVLFVRGNDKDPKKKGKASSINHSNVVPEVDPFSGGITFDHAVHTVVLSLPALRKLRFATTMKGDALGVDAENAARATLAALGLAAIVHLRERGYDLRSRSLLVPEGALELEVVSPSGDSFAESISTPEVNRLVRDAAAKVKAAGFAWTRSPIELKAAPKLIELVKRSRAEAVSEGAEN